MSWWIVLYKELEFRDLSMWGYGYSETEARERADRLLQRENTEYVMLQHVGPGVFTEVVLWAKDGAIRESSGLELIASHC